MGHWGRQDRQDRQDPLINDGLGCDWMALRWWAETRSSVGIKGSGFSCPALKDPTRIPPGPHLQGMLQWILCEMLGMPSTSAGSYEDSRQIPTRNSLHI